MIPAKKINDNTAPITMADIKVVNKPFDVYIKSKEASSFANSGSDFPIVLKKTNERIGWLQKREIGFGTSYDWDFSYKRGQYSNGRYITRKEALEYFIKDFNQKSVKDSKVMIPAKRVNDSQASNRRTVTGLNILMSVKGMTKDKAMAVMAYHKSLGNIRSLNSAQALLKYKTLREMLSVEEAEAILAACKKKKTVSAKKVNDADTTDIKAKNPGILELPENAFNEWAIGKLVKHFISLAKTKGKGPIMKAVVNLERWNKNDDPEIAKKARSIINQLTESEEWNKIKE